MMSEEKVSRQALWARREKERMRVVLGGRCAKCGTTENLTFDCIRPCGHGHHKAGVVGRIIFYREQMRRGNLQLLCALHNSEKQAKPWERYQPALPPESVQVVPGQPLESQVLLPCGQEVKGAEC